MASTTSRWTFVHTLSMGMGLALVVRMGLGHGLDFLPPSALKTVGSEECFDSIKTLKDCSTALSHALLGKHLLSKADASEGVLEPQELFFNTVIGTDSVRKEVLDILYKTKSVSAACCRSVNEINEKCRMLGLVLKKHLMFQLVSAFCKDYNN